MPAFDIAHAGWLANADELAALQPAFLESLSASFDAEALAGRVCPVRLADRSVAIFTLPEYVGSDLADELARRVVEAGQVLANPQRYVVAAPLLLAIASGRMTGRLPDSPQADSFPGSRTALAAAFQEMIDWGVRHGASDLHVNVHLGEAESEVRYTVAGRYVAPEPFTRMPTRMLMDMLSLAWMDIQGGNGAVFDPFSEQQGSMLRQVEGKNVMLRWSSLAADRGPSVCLRLLERDASIGQQGLQALGYLPAQAALITRAIRAEAGAVVFAGTVGSGKSTTLASLIAGLPADRKVVTLEDPVEYVIRDAVQNTVARHLDTDSHQAFAGKLRALKRSAMTDVLLGEIRDVQTGKAFMDLAGSGVNVYTTTHAASAAHIPERLASDFIGVPRDFLATPRMLKLLVFQALLPALCRGCSLPATALLEGSLHEANPGTSREDWRAWLDRLERLYGRDPYLLRIRNAEGCAVCRRQQLPALNGYAGRTVAAECIEPQLVPGFLHRVRKGRLPVSDIRPVDAAFEETGTMNAMDCAVLKAWQGMVDPRDIEGRFLAFETAELLSNPSRRASPLSGAGTRLRAVT